MGRTPLTTTLLGLAAGGALALSLGACGTDAVPQRRRPDRRQAGVREELRRPATSSAARAPRAPSARTSMTRSAGSVTDGLGRGHDPRRRRRPDRPSRRACRRRARSTCRRSSSRASSPPTSRPTSRASSTLPGQDTGRLGSAVAAPSTGKPVAAKAGKLAMPADPNGQFAYIHEEGDGYRPASSRSTPRTPPRRRTTSRSRATASTRDGQDRLRRRRVDDPRPTSSRARTSTTARCPATAPAAWKARSPSSRAAARRPALSAAPGCGSGCPRDRGRRSRAPRTAGRSAPGRPRRRRPAAARTWRRGRWWPG